MPYFGPVPRVYLMTKRRLGDKAASVNVYYQCINLRARCQWPLSRNATAKFTFPSEHFIILPKHDLRRTNRQTATTQHANLHLRLRIVHILLAHREHYVNPTHTKVVQFNEGLIQQIWQFVDIF